MFCVCQPWNVPPKVTFSCAVMFLFLPDMNGLYQGSDPPENTQ